MSASLLSQNIYIKQLAFTLTEPHISREIRCPIRPCSTTLNIHMFDEYAHIP